MRRMHVCHFSPRRARALVASGASRGLAFAQAPVFVAAVGPLLPAHRLGLGQVGAAPQASHHDGGWRQRFGAALGGRRAVITLLSALAPKPKRRHDNGKNQQVFHGSVTAWFRGCRAALRSRSVSPRSPATKSPRRCRAFGWRCAHASPCASGPTAAGPWWPTTAR